MESSSGEGGIKKTVLVRLASAKHVSSLTKSLAESFLTEALCDVALVTDEGRFIRGHKVILAAGSKYFKDIIDKATGLGSRNASSEVIICLPGMKYDQVYPLVKYIYTGEVEIPQACLSVFVKTAFQLKVTGLYETEEEEGKVPPSNSNETEADDDRHHHDESPPVLKKERISSTTEPLEVENGNDNTGNAPANDEDDDVFGDDNVGGEDESDFPDDDDMMELPEPDVEFEELEAEDDKDFLPGSLNLPSSSQQGRVLRTRPQQKLQQQQAGENGSVHDDDDNKTNNSSASSFSCSCCKKRYTCAKSLWRHKKYNCQASQNRMAFNCHLCGKSFSRSDNLRRHSIMAHNTLFGLNNKQGLSITHSNNNNNVDVDVE